MNPRTSRQSSGRSKSLPLAGEVLVELLGGVGGDGVVVRAIGDAAQDARQPLEFVLEPVAQRVQGDDALVGGDDEDLADGGGVQEEATVRRCGHATILARGPRRHPLTALRGCGRGVAPDGPLGRNG